MKFFTKYSLLTNIFLIITITVSIFFIRAKALETGEDPNKFSPATNVELTAFNFNYNSYDKNGRLAINFVTEKLEQYVNQDIKMINLVETSYDIKTGKETWNIKAYKGLSKQVHKNRLIHLYNGVDAVLFSKNQQNAIYINSPEMYYDTKTHDFYNYEFAKIYDAKTQNNTTSIGVMGNSDAKIIKFKKDVRSYYASS